MEIKERKSAVRAEMSAIRIRPEERTAASAAACNRLRDSKEFRSADTILIYAPLPDELDVSPLMTDEKRFCFPRYQANRLYVAAQVASKRELIPGKFGILEPPSDATEILAGEIALVILPGVAFDENCRRLGRGRGFYDRWLIDIAGHKIGVGFDHQLIDAVPCELHDVKLDSVVTPGRWLTAGAEN
ncbi:MAG: 5-formyltetrahydrofolate cyclo-ligase [Verrucomicrobia subdivision 3 bacterium]|nr:5-formyltetrahydrofolate cyclo-ligase [Limisphaerales bacterium]